MRLAGRSGATVAAGRRSLEVTTWARGVYTMEVKPESASLLRKRSGSPSNTDVCPDPKPVAAPRSGGDFGFTGILGKLISIDAEPLVFWRVTLGGLTTAAFLWFRSRWTAWTWANVLRVGLVGWVVAAHWVTFFASIKASSVGLALTMLATAPLFVGLIEPVVFKRSVAWREMAVAAVVFVGIALVFQAERDQTEGILLGLVSAALAALFSTVNGVLVKQHDPIQLSAVELLAASVGMACWLALQGSLTCLWSSCPDRTGCGLFCLPWSPRRSPSWCPFRSCSN